MTADPAVEEQDDGTVHVTLAADAGSAAVARRFLRQRWGNLDADVGGDVVLIVSELVSNAVQHGLPDIVLRLRVEPFVIDVAVLDHGPGRPQLPDATPDHFVMSGRGLAIVDHLASDWGVEPLDGQPGKMVWASIRRS